MAIQHRWFDDGFVDGFLMGCFMMGFMMVKDGEDQHVYICNDQSGVRTNSDQQRIVNVGLYQLVLQFFFTVLDPNSCDHEAVH